MDFVQYQNHECIAYKNSKYKNPFMHKSSVATWKTPKGRVVARGTCLTQEDIAMVQKRGPEKSSGGIAGRFDPKTKRGQRHIVGGVLLAIIIIAVLASG
jgi:hypothetical protein